jgi:hypothetical protein
VAASEPICGHVDGHSAVEALGIILRSFSRPANWPAGEDFLIERYFHQPACLRRMRDGIMSPYLGALAAELEAQHYSRKYASEELQG